MVTRRGIMIQKRKSPLARQGAVMCLTLAFLSGCAASSTDYPSFAIPKYDAQNNRVSIQFPGVEAPEPIDPETTVDPLPTDIDAQAARLTAAALDAISEFERNLDSVRRSVQRAKGAARTSDAWASAQVRLADLTSHHSEGRLALADLDLLAAKARISAASPETLSALVRAQQKLAMSLAEQDAALAAMVASLER